MTLRYVDPNEERGRRYRATVRFGRTPVGRAFARYVDSRIQPWLGRVTNGRSRPEWAIPVATLKTTGAKSGLPRSVEVTYFHDGRNVILVASNYGKPKNPQWYHNLLAHPECVLGGESFTATEVGGADEYDQLFALAERVFAGYHDYRLRTAEFGRRIPLLLLVPR